jgi:hypothetical protein
MELFTASFLRHGLHGFKFSLSFTLKDLMTNGALNFFS